MHVGCCRIELHIPASTSLKDKRRALKSVLARVRAKLNISAAEIEDQDLWQRAVVGVVCVSNTQSVIARTFEKTIRMIERHGSIYVTRYETEYF